MRAFQLAVISVLLFGFPSLGADTIYKGRSYPDFNKPYTPTVTPQQRVNINRQIYNRGYNTGVNSTLNNYYYYNAPNYNPRGMYINTYPTGYTSPGSYYYSSPPAANSSNYNNTNPYNTTSPGAGQNYNSSSGSQIYYQNY